MSPIATRLAALRTRIDSTTNPAHARLLIARLGKWFDPEAIAVLISLFDAKVDRAEYAERILVSFGEAAEAPLLECIASRDSSEEQRLHARSALGRLQFRARLEQVVGNVDAADFDLVA